MKLVYQALRPFDDITDVKISVSDRRVFIEHWSTLQAENLVTALNEERLGASLQERAELEEGQAQKWSTRELLRCCHVASQLLLLGCGSSVLLDSDPNWRAFGKALCVACVALSFPLFRRAFAAFLGLRANVDLLMASAMLGSLGQGAVPEAALVATLVSMMDVVTWASLSAVDRHLKRSLSVPQTTISLKGGDTIPAAELKAGMVFFVRAGDGIAADGTVVKGRGNIDEGRITGEAVPVTKEKGSKVHSGSVLQSGFLEVEADADVDSSFQAKIVDTVRQAKMTQSDTQVVVGKFAAWYTPAVILMAAVVAFVQEDLNVFLVIIVAGCPCALLGAAPFVQAATISLLARRHRLLLKDTRSLESLARLRWLGMDKTGTLTTGHFNLVKMRSVSDFTQKELLRWAAAVETKDPHPLAQSIVAAYTGCLVAFAGRDGLPELGRFGREGRCGVRGEVEGRVVGVGNSDFLAASKIPLDGAAAALTSQWSSQGTVLYVTVGPSIGGVLLLDDAVRSEAKETIARLKSLGVEVALLTGDKPEAAQRAAEAAGVEVVHAGLLPERKMELLLQASHGRVGTSDTGDLEKGLLASQGRGRIEVGFIGDGLNDCPALATANVGIAMQEMGSQALVDAASAVLQGELGELPAVITVARRAQNLVIANIVLAVSINMFVIVAAASIGLPLWLSVVLDSGSLLAVLANSLWPLCWRVDAVPGDAEATEAGGNLAFMARGRSASDSR